MNSRSDSLESPPGTITAQVAGEQDEGRRRRSRRQDWLTFSTRPEGRRHSLACLTCCSQALQNISRSFYAVARVSILYLSDEKGKQVHCDLKYASPSWCECASLIKASDPQSCSLPMNVMLARCSSSSWGGGMTETQTICFLFQSA